MSPDYPQYPQQPSGPFTPQPFDINALFKLLGVPPAQPLPSMGVGGGGIGGPIGVTPPMPPRGGPVQSLPPMPPQMPVAGMTPAPTPPQMPIRAVEDPYSTTPDLSPGMQRPPAQGLDVQKLLEMLRAMQGKGQTLPPQAPYVPNYTMPVPEMSPADIAREKAFRDAQEAEKAKIMGEMPRMPQGREGAPRMGPSPTMRGSGMGLEGILQGIEASRSSR